MRSWFNGACQANISMNPKRVGNFMFCVLERAETVEAYVTVKSVTKLENIPYPFRNEHLNNWLLTLT